MDKKILVVQVAALGYKLLKRLLKSPELQKLEWKSIETETPAVTCTVQASFRTGLPASKHGMVANGYFEKSLHKPFFWEQSSAQIQGERFWEQARANGRSVGQMFWQQSLGAESDLLINPAPIHKHHGGMIQDCYSKPGDLYQRIKSIHGGFNLMHYWGPLASVKSSEFIAKSTKFAMQHEAPDLLLTYLPHLDYELQKTGPNSVKAEKAFRQFENLMEDLMTGAKKYGYEVVIFGDYEIMDVTRPVYPNKILREHDLISFRQVKNMLYPDYFTSKSMAIVDHQVAHVVIWDQSKKEGIRKVFEDTPGVAQVLDGKVPGPYGCGHERSGDLVLVAEPDSWFSYQWWDAKKEAPDYATHVDIHNKPGFDPCELFFGFPPPFNVSTDSTKVGGSHGLGGAEYPAAWASTVELEGEIKTLIDLVKAVKAKLEC